MQESKNLARSLSFSLGFLALIFAVSGNVLAQDSLEGAWMLEQKEDLAGNIDTEPLRAMLLFTRNHYSIMIELGDKPRALTKAQPTDAQIVEAYKSINANSGRYEINGNRFIIHPYVSNGPNFSAAWPAPKLAFTFLRDGDTLVIASPEGGKATYRNVDDTPPPWKR